MSDSVSTNYRELSHEEVPVIAAELAAAWQDDQIPGRQYGIVKPELENYRKGGKCAPFDAFVRCMEGLPEEMRWPAATLLDIGASGGFYKEILQQNSFHCTYTACDFNPAFKTLAETLYPGIRFDIADARHLPYESGSFDIVANCAVLMHTFEYEQVIAETARVAKSYVLFHRTPILTHEPTKYFVKDGYDVPMFEAHFNEAELLALFAKYGLSLMWTEELFFDFEKSCGHRTYLLLKEPLIHHQV